MAFSLRIGPDLKRRPFRDFRSKGWMGRIRSCDIPLATGGNGMDNDQVGELASAISGLGGRFPFQPNEGL